MLLRVDRCVNGRPRCRRRGALLCGNSTCYVPGAEICCHDDSGRSRTQPRRHGHERCCGLHVYKSRGARRQVCRAATETPVDVLCPRRDLGPLGAPLSRLSRLCAGARHG